MNQNSVFLGTSGWSYEEWEGPFYKRHESHKLRAYSTVFKTVEIDSTFYQVPTKGTVLGWLRYSPVNFVFTAKLPKTITHDKMLGLIGNVNSELEIFFNIMRPLQLGGKLGCFLIQLPPKYDFQPESLEAFFKSLDTTFRFAVEFRNLSWMREETWDLLKEYDVAYAIVDEPLLPSEIHVTTDFAYFRWHGKGKQIWFDYKYSREELETWIHKVQDTAQQVKSVYGYFNNHYHGYAAENCLQLLERLGLLSEEQKRAKNRIKTKQSGLGSFLT